MNKPIDLTFHHGRRVFLIDRVPPDVDLIRYLFTDRRLGRVILRRLRMTLGRFVASRCPSWFTVGAIRADVVKLGRVILPGDGRTLSFWATVVDPYALTVGADCSVRDFNQGMGLMVNHMVNAHQRSAAVAAKGALTHAN